MPIFTRRIGCGMRLIIPGIVPSLKNQKRIARGRMYCDPQVMAYKRDFGLFIPAKDKLAKLGSKLRFLRVDVRLYPENWRRDADCEILYDCLQECGVISNDRWIRLKTINATTLDPINPRAEIDIMELAVGA